MGIMLADDNYDNADEGYFGKSPPPPLRLVMHSYEDVEAFRPTSRS